MCCPLMACEHGCTPALLVLIRAAGGFWHPTQLMTQSVEHWGSAQMQGAADSLPFSSVG